MAVCVVCADAAWRRPAGRASVLQISVSAGAGLAIPSTFRLFGLKRKAECGPCKACQVGCGSLAIDPKSSGKIDQREVCCASTAWCCTTTTTPARRWQRAQAARKAGLPLTPIGKGDGHPHQAGEIATSRQLAPSSSFMVGRFAGTCSGVFCGSAANGCTVCEARFPSFDTRLAFAACPWAG